MTRRRALAWHSMMQRRSERLCMSVLAAILILFCASLLPSVDTALGEQSNERPSVLVVDSCLGDYKAVAKQWLGDSTKSCGKHDGLKLVTANKPAWWDINSGSKTPRTFVLGNTKKSTSVEADDIVWALDKIRKIGAQPKTFVVAMGATGFSLLEYAEDYAESKQSKRADLVGFALCGTPVNGYSAIEDYPELSIWASIAKTADLAVKDLKPGSKYLKKLAKGTFPGICKVLSVNGAVGNLGFGTSDGAATISDATLGEPFASQTQTIQVNATLSRSLNLTGAWSPFTSMIDYPTRAVDSSLTERLSAMECYGISAEVVDSIQEFYVQWFADATPVTYNSSVLALDLSGSMLGYVDTDTTKLDAAKQAAKGYLQAVRANASLPYSAPSSVEVYGFSNSVSKIASGYSTKAVDAITAMGASGETDIGAVLDRALAAFESAPACATKHVLLVSDGASTIGKSTQQMLSSTVAQAKKAGIVIDCIGFGDIGESDTSFLKKLAKKTGGSYSKASSTYSLETSFLESYYSSLGQSMVDKELKDSGEEQLGTVEANISSLQIGIVSTGSKPNVKLLRDGVAVDESAYTVESAAGLISVQYEDPDPGVYSVELTGAGKKAHLFAVQQPGISTSKVASASGPDNSFVILAVAGVVLVAAIAGVLVLTRRRRQAHCGEENS